MPKISVIVPVYKVEDLLGRCVNSILDQTFSDFELILVDDGSPDRSGDICDEYARRDSRIRVLHQKNGGVSTARNNGLQAAKGTYITFIDSDDRVLPDYLEHMLRELELCGADLLITGFLRCVPSGDTAVGTIDALVCSDAASDYGIVMAQALEEGLLNPCWGKLYRADVIRSLVFPREICWGEDTVFVLKCLRACKKIRFLPQHEYLYRHADDGLDRSFKLEKPGFMLRYYRELFDFTERMLPDSAPWQRAVDIKVSQEILRTIFALSGQDVTPAQKKQYLGMLFSNKAVNRSFCRGVHHDDNPFALKLLSRFPFVALWLAFLSLRDIR